jgi:hypothetical protein
MMSVAESGRSGSSFSAKSSLFGSTQKSTQGFGSGNGPIIRGITVAHVDEVKLEVQRLEQEIRESVANGTQASV